jgi:hypothetical protein
LTVPSENEAVGCPRSVVNSLVDYREGEMGEVWRATIYARKLE